MKTDSELSSDVLAELLWDPLLPEARVGVTVNDGVVSVSGELETYRAPCGGARSWREGDCAGHSGGTQ